MVPLQNFDMRTCFTNKYTSLNGNMISRLRNSLANAIEAQPLLPRMVVIVLDDDIMTEFPFSKKAKPKHIAGILHWLMVEYDRLVTGHKENLQQKSKKLGYPSFMFIEAPYHENFHNNERREIFNEGLRTAGNLHDRVAVLELKKIWDNSNSNLYMKNERRYSAEGLRTYWEAVDKTIRFADTIQFKKMNQKSMKSNNDEQTSADTKSNDHHKVKSKIIKISHRAQHSNSYDKYHWHRPSKERTHTKNHDRKRRSSGSRSPRGRSYNDEHHSRSRH